MSDDDDPIWLLIKDRMASEDDWGDLLVGEQIAKIKRVLGAKFSDVENQLATQRARREVFRQACFNEGDVGRKKWFDSVSQYESWRASALHYRKLIQGKLARTKRAERDHLAERPDMSQLYRDVIRRLAVAIAEHQEAMHDESAPSRADLRLWAQLDRIVLPFGTKTASLAELADSVWNNDDEEETDDDDDDT
jgi:hypothetical protein